ncbi:type II secretion system protein [Haloferula sp.]|uniref:type II secretion system protein n=1 Tax=Haloferula sp. TaxID=2497595 RepID=UPI00329ED96B
MKNHARKQPKGMTLLELTVVILVLLALIGTLFSGARAWVRGSDKASCVMNIRKVQQAVRSYQNLNGLADGAALNVTSDLIGSGNFIETVSICPAGGTYTYGTTIPTLGTLVLSCSLETTEEHIPANHAGW